MTWREIFWKKKMLRPLTQMVHGCRQLVSWDIGLSSTTSATLIFSYFSKKTANLKLEEGEDDVKSSCLTLLGYTRATMGITKSCKFIKNKNKLIFKYILNSDCRLQLVYMNVGIASNRRSAILRWICSWVLYTPPVTPWELILCKDLFYSKRIKYF